MTKCCGLETVSLRASPACTFSLWTYLLKLWHNYSLIATRSGKAMVADSSYCRKVWQSKWEASESFVLDNLGLVGQLGRLRVFDFWFVIKCQVWDQIAWTWCFAPESGRRTLAFCLQEVLWYCWQMANPLRSKWSCCKLRQEEVFKFRIVPLAVDPAYTALSRFEPSCFILLNIKAAVQPFSIFKTSSHSLCAIRDLDIAFFLTQRPNDCQPYT